MKNRSWVEDLDSQYILIPKLTALVVVKNGDNLEIITTLLFFLARNLTIVLFLYTAQ
jgi:hypothetical protein